MPGLVPRGSEEFRGNRTRLFHETLELVLETPTPFLVLRNCARFTPYHLVPGQIAGDPHGVPSWALLGSGTRPIRLILYTACSVLPGR